MKTRVYAAGLVSILLMTLFYFSCNAVEYSMSDSQPANGIAKDPDDALISPSNFPDNNFRNFITNTMALVKIGDCRSITVLAVQYKSVTNLKGIQNFTSAKEIYLAHNSIVDVDAYLDGLTGLEVLDITDNPGLTPASKTHLDNLAAANTYTLYRDP